MPFGRLRAEQRQHATMSHRSLEADVLRTSECGNAASKRPPLPLRSTRSPLTPPGPRRWPTSPPATPGAVTGSPTTGGSSTRASTCASAPTCWPGATARHPPTEAWGQQARRAKEAGLPVPAGGRAAVPGPQPPAPARGGPRPHRPGAARSCPGGAPAAPSAPCWPTGPPKPRRRCGSTCATTSTRSTSPTCSTACPARSPPAPSAPSCAPPCSTRGVVRLGVVVDGGRKGVMAGHAPGPAARHPVPARARP